MSQVEKSVLVAHSAQQMFDLVDRCEDYPLFMPWCNRVDLRHRDERITSACLFIDFHHIKSHFTTENTKVEPKTMHIRLVEGPFRFLEGSWEFRALAEQACKIEFKLNYHFSNILLEKTIGPIFSKIANSFVDAFVLRAEKLYG